MEIPAGAVMERQLLWQRHTGMMAVRYGNWVCIVMRDKQAYWVWRPDGKKQKATGN